MDVTIPATQGRETQRERVRIAEPASTTGSVSVRASVLTYAFAVGLSVLIVTLVMQLWRADWHIPFRDSADGLLSSMLVKTVIENGWYLYNPSLGMPTGLEYGDYPFADTLFFLLIRLLSLVTHQFGIIINALYLLSFPLTTVTALFVFRRFRVSAPCAVIGSLLYTFLPFHFMRGEDHLFLSCYFLVPLAVMLTLWLADSDDRPWPRRRMLGACAISVLLGIGGVYYAAFSVFLFLFAGLLGVLRLSRLEPMRRPIGLTVIVLGVVLFNSLPNLCYWHTHGHNPEVAHRTASESETYGLRVTQLLLPVTGHRLRPVALGKAAYIATTPLINENDTATLGLVGDCGFVILLACLFLRRRDALPSPLDALASLNVFAVLLATLGGFGSLFALLISPQIRCYNRISIFIAFFALMAVVLCLDRWRQNSPAWRRSPLLWGGLLVGILALGVWDQTTPGFVPRYAELEAAFLVHDRFVGRIEAALPPRAMVYQLPYTAFPESPAPWHMVYYEHLRAYLHSRRLRWSAGAIKGRKADAWQHETAGLPPPQMVQALTAAGFSGVWVDSDGYTDGGLKLTHELAAALHEQPWVSDDRRLFFFRLPAH